MQSLPLFTNKKEILQTLLVMVVLFITSLSYEFYKYKNITTYSLYKTTAKVLNVYKKDGKNYRVLKLKSDNFTFYTTYKKTLELNRDDEIKIIFYTKGIDFYRYLKGFYVYSKTIKLEKKSEIKSVVRFVENQHKNSMIKELYSALFFATPISKILRKDISKWGIAHLVAISGFHLGILSAILYFLLKPIYTFFQDRYFPYRNRSADLAFIVFLILGYYTYFLGATPSILRAFVMSLVGFFLFSHNIKIISFGTLFFTVCIILILFIHLIFSIAFWLSVSGVFYIFLFLHHFSKLNKIAIFVLLNFWVYLLMLPIVHIIFDTFSWYQLFSPFISMLFLLFYPLSIFLHLVGLGGLMDSYIVQFLSLHVEVTSLVTPMWFFVSYIVLSLFAIRFRFLVFVLLLSALSLILGLI